MGRAKAAAQPRTVVDAANALRIACELVVEDARRRRSKIAVVSRGARAAAITARRISATPAVTDGGE